MDIRSIPRSPSVQLRCPAAPSTSRRHSVARRLPSVSVIEAHVPSGREPAE